MSALIRGAGGGGGKGGGGSSSTRAPVESPDSLRSRQYARVIDLVSEGEIVGLVDSLRSVYLDDTPIQSADGTLNFSGVTLTTRSGTQAQAYIPGFPAVEAETPVSAEILYAGPVVRSISNINANAVRVTVGIPRLTYQNTTTGDLSGTAVTLAVDVNNNGGGYVQAIYDTISGKTTSKYQRAYRIALPSPGPWDIRVRRLTPDSTTSNIANATWFDSYTEIIDSKLRYPNSALCALAVDAEQFNAIPRRGYEIKGLIVQVPSNYNPIARSYSGVWDGTFTPAWTDNPAWCFYDLITNDRYGLGDFINADQVDKWTLYAIGQYCDALVSDGFGGLEPRFTCNLYLQTREEAYRVVNAFASIFRGMVYWAGGAITAVQDAPRDVAALFAPANVLGGQFNYEGSSAKARHTVALVSWNDPTDRYRQKIEYAEDEDGIVRYGVIQSEILAVGCASRGQAHRLGRWMLYTERLESETVSFRAGLDGLTISPGEIIQTTDPVRAGVRMGGRLISATTTAVTLDASVTISAGKTYVLWAALPDGTVESRAVTTGASTTDALSVTPAFSVAPQALALWVLAANDLAPETWRVVNMSEVDGTHADITAVAHDTRKFDAIENDLVLEPLQTSAFLATPAAPFDLHIAESLYLVNPAVVGTRITVSWQGDAPFYELRYRRAEQNWTTLQTTTNSIDIQPAEPGIYNFSAIAINAIGRRSAPATLTAEVYGLLAPPADVTGLSLQAAGGLAILTWALHPDIDVRVGGKVRIRHCDQLTGATWETSVSIGEAVGGNTTIAVLPLKSGTYLVRAEDSSGVLSVNAASASTKQATALAWSPLGYVQEDDDFTGTHDRTYTEAGLLFLGGSMDWDDIAEFDAEPTIDYAGGVSAAGTYDFATGLDLGTVQHVRLTSTIAAQAVNISDNFDARPGDLDTWADFDGTGGAPVDAWVEVRDTDDDPAGTPLWSNWRRLDAGEFESRGFDFRVQLTSGDDAYTINISQLRVSAAGIT